MQFILHLLPLNPDVSFPSNQTNSQHPQSASKKETHTNSFVLYAGEWPAAWPKYINLKHGKLLRGTHMNTISGDVSNCISAGNKHEQRSNLASKSQYEHFLVCTLLLLVSTRIREGKVHIIFLMWCIWKVFNYKGWVSYMMYSCYQINKNAMFSSFRKFNMKYQIFQSISNAAHCGWTWKAHL